MSENLKIHRPDIKVLGEGRAIAFMPEDPMGVWCHIQEVRDLLDVKDKVIAELEENHKNEVGQLLMKIAGLEKLVETADKIIKQKGGFTIECDTKADWYYGIGRSFRDRVEFYIKWHKRWLELAEKFKEAK